MSPTIVLNGSRVELVVGAAGGPRIINATLQTILNVLEFKMPIKDAVETARLHHQWLPDRIGVESNIPSESKRELEKRGHALREQSALGVVQAIAWNGKTMSGAADSRKVERARLE
jgi:gamma-glutamyltranspeptidase/glutathione hydrolase